MEADFCFIISFPQAPFEIGPFRSWLYSSLPPPVRQRPWQRAVFCFVTTILIHHSDFPYSWSSYLDYESLHLPSACRFLIPRRQRQRGHPTSCGSNILPHTIFGSSFLSTCPRLFWLSPVRPLFRSSSLSAIGIPFLQVASIFKFPMLSGLDMNFLAGPRLTYGFAICNGNTSRR